MGTDESTGEVEKYLIGEAVGEYVVEVVRDIRGRDVWVMMVVGMLRWDGQREGGDRSLGIHNEGVLDHRSCTGKAFKVVGVLDRGVVRMCGDHPLPALVLFHQVNLPLEERIVECRWEGGEVVKPGENTTVEELVVRQAELVKDRALYDKSEFGREFRVVGRQVDGGDDAVKLRVEESFDGAINGVHKCFAVKVEVNQLGPNVTLDVFVLKERETYLRPSDIGRDDVLDVPDPEDPEHGPPQVPLGNIALALEEFSGLLSQTTLVLVPSQLPIPTLILLQALESHALGREDAWKDEDRGDLQLLERLEVGLQPRGQCQRQTTRGGE